jgi:hypothetical protein
MQHLKITPQVLTSRHGTLEDTCLWRVWARPLRPASSHASHVTMPSENVTKGTRAAGKRLLGDIYEMARYVIVPDYCEATRQTFEDTSVVRVRVRCSRHKLECVMQRRARGRPARPRGKEPAYPCQPLILTAAELAPTPPKKGRRVYVGPPPRPCSQPFHALSFRRLIHARIASLQQQGRTRRRPSPARGRARRSGARSSSRPRTSAQGAWACGQGPRSAAQTKTTILPPPRPLPPPLPRRLRPPRTAPEWVPPLAAARPPRLPPPCPPLVPPSAFPRGSGRRRRGGGGPWRRAARRLVPWPRRCSG